MDYYRDISNKLCLIEKVFFHLKIHIFSLKDIFIHNDILFENTSFHGDISFKIVMVQYGLLIKIKS